ncbi:sensor histidine kinase [Paenibacillus vini]|uniref:histidine kinase n=1 Tax=Paenibacillus vini TaxID=1476024 RepID=A0ABQ4MCV6_9BACL|nr:HAMP domain-containing sensor histidine kinase [Paenibacillus vini]GIP53836.1 hypothetical protein J42TS3_28710 [Paenibacillus vini]
MRTLRIRTFTLLCFFFILSAPWIFFVISNFMETNTLGFSRSQAHNELIQEQLTETTQLIEAGAGKWNDPQWIDQLQIKLRETEMEAVILDASDQVIFRSALKGMDASAPIERLSILEDGRKLGEVVIYLPKTRTVQMIAAITGLLLAFFIVGFEMRRFLLKPLEKMGYAARQIATGDLDVQLPSTKITEIAEVRDGFELMVKGLRQSIQKQVELEEERRFVISAVAHDLRTPLFALRGYLDGLEQGVAQSPEKMNKYLAVCKEKSAQLDRLVEDLFTFTKMDYLESKLITETLDLNLIFRKSIDSLSLQAQQKQITISLGSQGVCSLNGDPHLLERAMNNLLDNAVRHTPIYGKIEVNCYLEEDKVLFKIRDTGPGFTEEEMQHVFEPLYRGEQSRNRSTGGSGLGLTISQRIVRMHGGDLAASNHPEGGALLTGSIPAAVPE